VFWERELDVGMLLVTYAAFNIVGLPACCEGLATEVTNALVMMTAGRFLRFCFALFVPFLVTAGGYSKE
jgi:hypothetical protein